MAVRLRLHRPPDRITSRIRLAAWRGSSQMQGGWWQHPNGTLMLRPGSSGACNRNGSHDGRADGLADEAPGTCRCGRAADLVLTFRPELAAELLRAEFRAGVALCAPCAAALLRVATRGGGR